MTDRIRPPVGDFRRLAEDGPDVPGAEEAAPEATPPPAPEEPAPSGPPVVLRFVAEPRFAVRGHELQLSWSVDGTDTITLNGLGEQPATGTLSVTADQTGRFRLDAGNAAGQVSATTELVRVVDVPPFETVPVPLPVLRLSLELPTDLAGRPPATAFQAARDERLTLPALPGTGLPALPRPALDRVHTDLAIPALPSLTALPLPSPRASATPRTRRLWRWAKELMTS